MIPYCLQNNSFLTFQKNIIMKHLGNKNYTFVERQVVVAKFIKENAQSMRKAYCETICPCHGDCPLIKHQPNLIKK